METKAKRSQRKVAEEFEFLQARVVFGPNVLELPGVLSEPMVRKWQLDARAEHCALL